jgi:protein SEY1
MLKVVEERSKEWVQKVDEKTFKKHIEEEVGRVQAEFQESTTGYEEEVRAEATKKLESDIWPLLQDTHENFVRSCRDRVEKNFATSLDALLPEEGGLPQSGFASKLKEVMEGAMRDFKSGAEALVPRGAPWRDRLYEKDGLVDMLQQHLRREEDTAKKQLAAQVKATCQQTLKEKLSRALVPLLDESAPSMWVNVRRVHEREIEAASTRIVTILKDIGMWSKADEEASTKAMRTFAGVLVNDKFADKAQEASLADKILAKFDAAFNRGRSRVWRLWDSPDQEVIKARELGLLVLDMFSASQLYEDGAWPQGQSRIAYIDETRKDSLASEFEARVHQELVWAQVTRANSSTHSSVIIAALVMVLGWNEILWLITNPIYFILFVMAAGGSAVYYFLQRVGDWQQLVALALKTLMNILSPAPPPPYSATNSTTPTAADPLAHAAHLAGPPGRERRPMTAPIKGNTRTVVPEAAATT